MFLALVKLVIGFLFLVKGADCFVDGALLLLEQVHRNLQLVLQLL